jgi:hypothetical protein
MPLLCDASKHSRRSMVSNNMVRILFFGSGLDARFFESRSSAAQLIQLFSTVEAIPTACSSSQEVPVLAEE